MAVANPKPVQKPHPPIWIGAGGPSTLRVTARHADVWNASGARGPEGAIEASRRLDEICAEIGRDHGEIRRSAQMAAGSDPAELVERLHRHYEAGFSELVIDCRGADPVTAAELAAERVLPALRATLSPA